MAKSLNVFIDQCNLVHNNYYDYSIVKYINNQSNIEIICRKHGGFKQRASHHLRGSGCKKCNYGRPKLTMEEILKRFRNVHGNRYIYDKVFYSSIHEYVTIICKFHNEFRQTPHKHMNGRGCPICGDKFGIKENKWLDSLNINNRQVRIGKYTVDGYDPKLSPSLYFFSNSIDKSIFFP